MTAKIVLNSSRDIPFNKLVLSQSNVRRIQAGVSIEELSEDIAGRGLIQGLNVRPIHDAEGAETGLFEVPAGGRRFRALQRLVRQKRLAKTAPVPCTVRTSGIAEEDSLAENVQRAPLHPLDQFRAFRSLREDHQLDDEEIAARFFVSVQVVRQRLKLAAASPKLLDLYVEGQLTLEQLMAFCIIDDHERQEQIWDALEHGYSREPATIRRMLTEGAVRPTDKRARFVGPDAYRDAGGVILRDLFNQDDGGWYEDAGLLDRLARDKLEAVGDAVRAEGWKWLEVAPDFPYGHTSGLRRAPSTPAPVTDQEQAAHDALRAEYQALEETWAEAEELPEEIDARFGELETALEAFQDRPAVFEAEDLARAGAFVSLTPSGEVKIERGFVRPEDEPPVEVETPGSDGDAASEPSSTASEPENAPSEDEDAGPGLSQQLRADLTSWRTVALRHAVAEAPEVAFLAVLHVLCLKAFYTGYAADTCLEIEARSAMLPTTATGLNGSRAAKALDQQREAWIQTLPERPSDLWAVLSGFDGDSRASLFAHCAARTINAVDAGGGRGRAIRHADHLAQAVDLDMAANWTPTAEAYLSRVTKGQILEAVREATGEAAAQRIDHLRKGDMAKEAERLLADTGWLPDLLRTPGASGPEEAPADGEPVEPSEATEETDHAVAAE